MTKNNLNILYNSFYLSLVLGLTIPISTISANPQNEQIKPSNQHVRWVGSYSSSEDFKKEESLTKSVVNFLFGKDEVRLIRPISIVAKADRSIYVLDQGAGAFLKIDPTEKDIILFPMQENESFPSLVSLCKTKNNILFTDSKLNKIFIQNSTSLSPQVLNDSLKLNQPTGIAFNFRTNQIWVVETAAHKIAILDNDGKFLKYVGSRGKEEGKFNFPTFIWIDSDGMVYVIDSMNFRLQILNSDGSVISVFGEAGDATGYFARPKGVATDSKNNIYIVDALFHVVQIFSHTGNYMHSFGTQGSGKGEFWMPSGIYIDETDKIYVADSYNARVQVFELNGKTMDGVNEN